MFFYFYKLFPKINLFDSLKNNSEWCPLSRGSHKLCIEGVDIFLQKESTNSTRWYQTKKDRFVSL